MERPGLKRLLAEVEARCVDVVVVYKVDRPTRSLGGAVRRVGADALETFILAELRRLADRPSIGAEDVPALLTRLELRSSDTHLLLDRDALFAGDHPELALEDLRERLQDGERLLVETSGQALRIALPRRMQLRGGRGWNTARRRRRLSPGEIRR